MPNFSNRPIAALEVRYEDKNKTKHHSHKTVHLIHSNNVFHLTEGCPVMNEVVTGFVTACSCFPGSEWVL